MAGTGVTGHGLSWEAAPRGPCCLHRGPWHSGWSPPEPLLTTCRSQPRPILAGATGFPPSTCVFTHHLLFRTELGDPLPIDHERRWIRGARRGSLDKLHSPTSACIMQAHISVKNSKSSFLREINDHFYPSEFGNKEGHLCPRKGLSALLVNSTQPAGT